MKEDPPHLATRLEGIEPFHVMALLARARELEAQGRSIIHMEIGEPDFQTPQPTVDAALKAIAVGDMHYLPALGMPALREAIARYYGERYGVEVSPSRVVVTPGASGALLLAIAAAVRERKGALIVDEIYHGLTYDGEARTALALGDDVFVITASRNTSA